MNHVIDERRAREIAEPHLDGVAITSVEEVPAGWVFYWNSVEYVETGDDRHAVIGNAPLFVDREDGVCIRTGTGPPVEFFIDAWLRQRAWRRSAPIGDVLASDAVEELALLGPEMKVPVRDRLRARQPDVDDFDIDRAVECAIRVGELALALTEGAGLANDPIMWRKGQLEADGGVPKPSPDVEVVEQLAAHHPSLYRPALFAIVARARYWWCWDI